MQLAWSAHHMPHKPVKIHIRRKDTVAIPSDTKRADAVTILVRNYGVFFQNLQKPVEFLVYVTNVYVCITGHEDDAIVYDIYENTKCMLEPEAKEEALHAQEHMQ